MIETFSTIIIAKNLKVCWELSFDHSMKKSKYTKYLMFIFHQVKPSHVFIIINKGHKLTNT